MKMVVHMALTGLFALVAAMPARAADDAALERHMYGIASEQDARVADVLPRIDGPARKLLALRSYLRSSPHLAERWSWTEEQIADYEGSDEHQALQQEIERVRAAFVAASPGYELYVNPAVRSLDTQVASWNSNESVGVAADRLLKGVYELLARPGFPASDPQLARQALEAYLMAYVPEPTPTVAAPGLSPHGQMRAVDFQVEAGGKIIAGPDTKTIDTVWASQGWARKLEAAVRTGTNQFIGPLLLPHEPWHYTYTPDAVAGK